jgi:hypothetical protein
MLFEEPVALEPAVLEELTPLPLEPVTTVEPVELELVPAVLAAADEVIVLRDSAGSWPVMSTTAITDHTAMNSATDAPTTRPRMSRTRARLSCLILSASAEVMPEGSAGRVADACGRRKKRV